MAKKGNRIGGKGIAKDHGSVIPDVEPFLRDALKVDNVKVHTGKINPKGSGERRVKITTSRPGTISIAYTCAGCQVARVSGPPDKLNEVVAAWQKLAAKERVKFVDAR